MFTARPFASPDAQRLLELLNTLLGSTFRQILWRNAAELELTYAQAQVLFYVAQHLGCPADRRVSILELTAEGQALVQELERVQVEALDPVLQRLSARDRNRLIKGLEKFVEAVTGGPQEASGKLPPVPGETPQCSLQ